MSEHESRGRVWRPDWRLLLLALVLLPVLLGLGFWQLGRAAEKEQLLSQWSDPARATEWGQLDIDGAVTGQPISLTGDYGAPVWLLDNRTRDGAPGYEVLSLFHPDQGPPVLVNRGWVLAERRRDQLPEIDTPQGPVRLLARVADYPVPPVLAGEPTAGEQADRWPRRVQALPKEQVVRVEPEVAARTVKLDDSNQPGAFRADWEPDMMEAQTHYGYALQWFSMAAALIILTIIASFRKQES
ncbi:SURF1 family protein [Marinobacter zhanjiangensis]|uniref:SURF1-like protein n=1 Tax=Marinobacter zhanjiangensis TaxID=578215 RepID=A0ABQ3ANM2_9GAMM|nr:SURF1 family protein [Marinobacter zhanjiangensis]GGY60802.1 SURF1-like protein [Marinobacter zhanjiangensis]